MKKLLLLLMLIPAQLFAENETVNENELFSGNETVIENKVQDKTLTDTDKRSVGISGQVISSVQYTNIDKNSNYTTLNEFMGINSLTPEILGDLYFDARLPGGYKGFGSFELEHNASIDEQKTGNKQTTFSAKEIFVDFNFNRYVYFRAGKQVLQWGQCYLWNPTDMINIEKKSFLNKLSAREGTDGLKMHIPFGTAINIYGFANVEQANSAGDVAGAGKFEFLIKGTEMAFSIWDKKSFNPVYGYDFSSRVLGIDIKGEASYSHGSNIDMLVADGINLTTKRYSDKDIYKASINFGRDFDFGEKANNLNISCEMFYNGDGYAKNPFADSNSHYLYYLPMGSSGIDFVGDKKTYLIGKGLYDPNYLSKYYAALFVTVKEFIISELTLSLNGITNIQQNSYIVTSGLSYTNINDFTAGATVNGYIGDKDGEYRASGVNFSARITAGILF